MSTKRIRRLPRVMPLARAAREVLCIDPHEAYRLAREGGIDGSFKVGKHWYVTVPKMITAMQGASEERDASHEGMPPKPDG